MKQFDKITATFRPRRTDSLIAGAEKWIGYRGVWQAAYILEEGAYAGEWAMECVDDPTRWDMPFAWVPITDLEV